MRLRRLSGYLGLVLAIAILGFWLLSGVFFLNSSLANLGLGGILLGIFVRTWLHTGLFIVGHDAMHGHVAPRFARLNRSIGQLAVFLYACLPYNYCRRNHRLHHQFPGQNGDPDFHDGIHLNFHQWYLRFIWGYFSWTYFLRFSTVVLCLAIAGHWLFSVAYANTFLFLLLPLVLSSIQLFFFGTYLPHGQKAFPKLNSQKYPLGSYLWSLVSCYHFGVYHEEHHVRPDKPWFQLPNLIATPNQDQRKKTKPYRKPINHLQSSEQ